MKIGIGLPTTIPGAKGSEVTEWARRADAAGFSTVGTIDRIVYPNYEPFIGLAAAAAVTERINLTTAIAILPLPPELGARGQAAGNDSPPFGWAAGAARSRRHSAGRPGTATVG